MSEIKTDKIIPVDAGGTSTLGCTGDTIATGAGTTLTIQGTYSGINSINWDTTAKTANFTAETNRGYFINTTSGSVTISLPATPVAGTFIGIKDYALTAQTNNIIINPNGNKIQGSTSNFFINTQGGAANLVYVDSTQGWLTYDAAQASDITQAATFITATGGCITTCGDFKIHTFNSPGTFCVSSLGNGPTNPLGGPQNVDYLVVAGGGGGGSGESTGGGGGAGGYRTSFPTCGGSLPVSVTGYPITVGGGGNGGPTPGYNAGINGSNSIFSTITSAGGGGGGSMIGASRAGNGSSGGAGGGGGGGSCVGAGSGGAGNTPPVSPSQGNNGGSGTGNPGNAADFAAGGGGGAGTVGTNASNANGGAGGTGSANSISGSPVFYAGGGGGGKRCASCGSAGAGGNGGGGAGSKITSATATSGTSNTGGGGGGGALFGNGASGGSGIVIIRYRYQ